MVSFIRIFIHNHWPARINKRYCCNLVRILSNLISDKYDNPIPTFTVRNMEELEVEEHSFQKREKHQFGFRKRFVS